ncbi:MAG: preprotein translocase subunit YajC [Proteobacteria bacterium]|nr:preprotein translocase subunit YajC [Pseudomonadota bacterium]
MISAAWAQDAAATPGLAGQLFGFLPIILIFAVFYFLIIRPQNEEAKKHAAMIKKLEKGDKVVTQSGVWGTLLDVHEKTVHLEAGDGVVLTFSKDAIGRVLTADDAKILSMRKNSQTAAAKKR